MPWVLFWIFLIFMIASAGDQASRSHSSADVPDGRDATADCKASRAYNDPPCEEQR